MATLEEIQKELQRLDSALDPESSTYKAAVLLLASGLAVGPHVRKLSKFTGYPPAFIRPIAKRLRDNGIWDKGKVIVNWFDEGGGVDFWMDVAVAEGYMERSDSQSSLIENGETAALSETP